MKTILIFYIDIGNESPQHCRDTLTQVQTMFDREKPKDHIHYYLPIRKGGHRVECINPSVVSKNFHNDLRKTLEELNGAVKEWMKKNITGEKL